MKTLTLHVNDNIYEDVKTFLALFSQDKMQVETHSGQKAFFNSCYLNALEINKMMSFFEKFNIPAPKNVDKIQVAYPLQLN